ncbi:hypothetical protein AX17_007311 [Amanita inopinata Kibby_2008]|nr:hypothetical protein AX17_007311 [Amanita inopinata Kibby_2008]
MPSQFSLEALSHFSDGPRHCIERLRNYFKNLEYPDVSAYPSNKLAAVLVLLFEQDQHLRILLTTRSKSLRTHAGQTALPGGKMDSMDANLIDTAYREAHEEVGLSLGSPDVHTLGILEPVISFHKLLVTPVVAILTNPSLIRKLQAAEGEVSWIFDHPLESFLDPSLLYVEQLASQGSENWPYDTEFYVCAILFEFRFGSKSILFHSIRQTLLCKS